jgi:uncharacterized DUF497 family protein
VRFEWDEIKAKSNLHKHGVSFAEAASVFNDRLAITFDDPDHSGLEHRWITIGYSKRGRLLVVSNTERGAAIRIISARKATKREIRIHES